ncbi:MAG: hypothetical protein AAF483_29920 [Planctomycetota bacterium]
MSARSITVFTFAQPEANANKTNADAFKTMMETVDNSDMSPQKKEAARDAIFDLYLGPDVRAEAERIESELRALAEDGVRLIEDEIDWESES